MSKVSDSIQRGLEEAVAYAKGEADKSLFRIHAAKVKALKGQANWNRLSALTDEKIKQAMADDPDRRLAGEKVWKKAQLLR